ncbi:MAG: NADP oxidoreductase [Chloroflexaceae bacterium]|nr:NADP oxidoreductase [Chloroflexaceae bacterium]
MNKVRLATVWLDGCSGCHMSFLDMDERLLELADRIELVYSPLVDIKTFPQGVDITLVEGAVSTRDDWEKIKHIRERTTTLVSLGDCAVTGNVPSMRNLFSVADVMERAYTENVSTTPRLPENDDILPALLSRVRPVHEVVPVDLFVPGCPPPADAIVFAVSELLEGRRPAFIEQTRFGR